MNAICSCISQSLAFQADRCISRKPFGKKHLKNQGFKINIAGQGKVDQLRKERVDYLYEITSIKGNVGTEQKYKEICVVYCNNVCELDRGINKSRKSILDTCKLQGDHGQVSLNIPMQFDFSNFVNSLIILSIKEES